MVEELFSQGGALAAAMPGFESRPQQAELAAAVSASLASGRHLLAAGLSVYRADPPALPSRPLLGSVPGKTLACCGVTSPTALTSLSVSTGTLAGRSREYLRKIARSAFVKRRRRNVAFVGVGRSRLVEHGDRRRGDVDDIEFL